MGTPGPLLSSQKKNSASQSCRICAIRPCVRLTRKPFGDHRFSAFFIFLRGSPQTLCADAGTSTYTELSWSSDILDLLRQKKTLSVREFDCKHY